MQNTLKVPHHGREEGPASSCNKTDPELGITRQNGLYITHISSYYNNLLQSSKVIMRLDVVLFKTIMRGFG